MVFVLPASKVPRTSPVVVQTYPRQRHASQTFAIGLRRLGSADGALELIELTIARADATGPARTAGALTDAAVRARLGHTATHSANEVAAIRQALAVIDRQVTILEEWPDESSCLHFWSAFGGLQIRLIHWKCEHCGVEAEEKIGGSVGESVNRPCGCGKPTRITIPKLTPSSA